MLKNIIKKIFGSDNEREISRITKLVDNINGLEVRPVFSPHPVETNILFFSKLCPMR